MNNVYRKKPILVEAFQITAERRWDNSEWPNWLHQAWQRGAGEGGFWCPNPAKSPAELRCGTLEGVMRIDPDDWIIQGIKGEIYTCKPDIFAKLYDKVLAEAPEMDGRAP